MVNYYIASLKLLPTIEYESKQNFGLTIVDINPVSNWFFQLQ
jgi:hypothetical protein